MLDKKLQIRDGQTIALLGQNVSVALETHQGSPDQADSILVFAVNEAQLHQYLDSLSSAANGGKLTWVAYPKAGQLGTDLNRDTIREIAGAHGLDTVRQIAIDETWSALRLKASSGG